METRLQLCGEKRREPREVSAHGLFQRELVVRGWGGQSDSWSEMEQQEFAFPCLYWNKES